MHTMTVGRREEGKKSDRKKQNQTKQKREKKETLNLPRQKVWLVGKLFQPDGKETSKVFFFLNGAISLAV